MTTQGMTMIIPAMTTLDMSSLDMSSLDMTTLDTNKTISLWKTNPLKANEEASISLLFCWFIETHHVTLRICKSK